MNNKQDNQIDALLETHGKRIKPDDLMAQRAKNNVRAHWQASIENTNKPTHRQKKKLFTVIRMSAAVVLMVTTGFLIQYNLQQTPIQFSHDLFVQGELMVSEDGQNWHLNNKDHLNQNTWMKTNANSFANITLADRSQLRINQNSELKLVSASDIELINGEIYHDADNLNQSNIKLIIKTAFGDIQHIGTRYLVNKTPSSLLVAVRNGLVEVHKNKMKTQLKAGNKVDIDSSGHNQISEVMAYDSIWQWTQTAAKPFDSQDQTLNGFITWFAHENGYQINWNQLESKTKRVKLSGNLSNLDMSQQIKTVFLATKFDYEINQGILSIL